MSLRAVMGQQPPVTRCLAIGSGLVTVAHALDLLTPATLLLSWQRVIYELQLWRPLKSLRSTSKASFKSFKESQVGDLLPLFGPFWPTFPVEHLCPGTL